MSKARHVNSCTLVHAQWCNVAHGKNVPAAVEANSCSCFPPSPSPLSSPCTTPFVNGSNHYFLFFFSAGFTSVTSVG